MQRQKTSAAQLPVLDENTLQQLLGAAWVMQEHNDRLLTQQSTASPSQKSGVLAEIVEMQNLIQGQPSDLRGSCRLIAQGLQRMLEADGAAIGCVQDGQLHYLTALGRAGANDNLLLPPEHTLGNEVLRTGRLLQSPNPESDPRIPTDACRRAGAKSLVLVPIFHEQRVKGVLELWFSRSRWLEENDLRLCQLMAGLVTEAIVCAAQQQAKTLSPDDLGILLPAVTHMEEQTKYRIKDQVKHQVKDQARNQTQNHTKPQLTLTADSLHVSSSAPVGIEKETAAPRNKVVPFPAASVRTLTPEREDATTGGTETDSAETAGAQSGDREVCRGCGHQFVDNEAFCGACGMTRRKETDLQGKWASLWYMQQAHHPKSAGGRLAETNEEFSTDALASAFKLDPQTSWAPSFKSHRALDEFPSDLPSVAHSFAAAPQEVASPESDELAEQTESEKPGKEALQEDLEGILTGLPNERRPALHSREIEAEPDSIATGKTESSEKPGGKNSMVLAPWTSAARARSWLETIKSKPAKQEWFAAYRANLYLVIAAVLLLIAVSGWGTKSSADQGDGAANISAQPRLTWLQKLLVETGIAVAPQTPDYASSGNPNTQVWLDIHTALYYCPGAPLYGKTMGGRFATQKDAQLDQFEPALRQACN